MMGHFIGVDARSALAFLLVAPCSAPSLGVLQALGDRIYASPRPKPSLSPLSPPSTAEAPGICPLLLSCSVVIISQTKLYIYPGSEAVIRGPKAQAYLQLSKCEEM